MNIKPYINNQLKPLFRLLLCFLMLLYPMTIKSQNTTVEDLNQTISLNLSKPTLQQVFNKIEEATPYTFGYNSSQIDVDKPLPIELKGSYTLANILREIAKASSKKIGFRKLGENISVFVPNTIKKEDTSLVQNRTVKGKVTDELNQPLPGVTVFIKGTSNGVETNFDGLYTINTINASSLLVFSFLGYKKVEIVVGNQKTINVKMEFDGLLDEIVITGYQKISKERINGSVSVVNTKQLEKQISVNILDKIEGLTTGVSIATNDTGEQEINIRGISTFSNNTSPLFVVDGIPIEGGLGSINTFDIKSVNILKDASAASIWGSKASNGVIVITTKNGSEGESDQGKITFNSNFVYIPKPDLGYLNYISPNDLIDFEIETFKTIDNINEAANIYRPVTALYVAQQNGLISIAERNNRVHALRQQNNRNQIEDLLYQTNFQHQYNFSYSWGREKRNTYASLNYIGSNGQLVGRGSETINLNLNEGFQINEKLRIGASINFNFGQSKASGAGTDVFNQASYALLQDVSGNNLPWYTQTNQFEVERLLSEGFFDETEFYLKDVELNNAKFESITSRLQLSLDYKILDWLNFSGRAQYEFRNNKNKRVEQFGSSNLFRIINNETTFTNDEQPIYNVPIGDRFIENRSDLKAYTVRGQLNFDKTFLNKHQIFGILGTEVRDTQGSGAVTDRFGVFALDFPAVDQTYDNVLLGANNLFETQERFFSLFMAANYAYNNRYDLSASARVDQGNLFGVNERNKYRPLWSLGLGWTVSNESFYKSNLINRLKVRLTVGTGGLAPAGATAFQTLQGLGISNFVPGQLETSIFNRISNPNLKWELTTTYNAGVDMQIFDNRVKFSLDAYARFSEDLLSQSEPIDPTTGISNTPLNIGKVNNKGLEFSISGDIIDARDFVWNSSLNFSYNKSDITKLQNISATVNPVATANSLLRVEGLPVDAIFSWRYAGLDNNGQPMVLDTNGVATSLDFTQNNTPIEEVLVYSGTTRAPYTSGWSNTFSYKGFSLTFLMIHSGGHVLRNDVAPLAGIPSGTSHQDLATRWRQSGDENTTEIIAPRYDQDGISSLFNSYWRNADVHIRDADYIKLRNINLSYILPPKVFGLEIPFKQIKAEFQIRNVGLLWTANDDGIDPERFRLSRGTRRFPSQPTYTFGLNIKF